MSRPIIPRSWNDEDLSADLVGEPTPPAAAALLIAADAWPVAVAVTPYVGTGHIVDACTSSDLLTRYAAVMVAPGAEHARIALSRRAAKLNGGGQMPSPYGYHEITTDTGGTTGNNVIRVAQLNLIGLFGDMFFQLPNYGNDIAVSGPGIDDTPSNPIDRELELTTQGSSYAEGISVSQVAGWAVVVSDQIDDLESL